MIHLEEVAQQTGKSVDALIKSCQRGELAGVKVPKKPGSKIMVWALPDAVYKSLLTKQSARPYDDLINEWKEFQRNGRLTKKCLEERTIEINVERLETYWKYLREPNWKRLKEEGRFDFSKIKKDIADITAENFEICMANWEPPDKEKQTCHFSGKINTYKAVRSFCKYLIKVGLKPSSMLEDLAEQRPQQIYLPKRGVLSKNELKDVLEKNEVNLTGGRDDEDIVLTDIIVKVLGLAGVRLSELIGLKLSNFSYKKRELFIPAAISKTHRSREIGLRPDLCQAIQDYIKKWRPVSASDSLLLQKDGKPITRYVIRGRLERAGKKAGLSRSHAHMYRRAFATIHADMGIPITHLRDQLGHTRESTTELYLRTSNETAKGSLKNIQVDDGFEVVQPKKKLSLDERLALLEKM